MPTPDFRSALIAFIRENALPVEKFSHQPRLYLLSQQVGAGQRYDDDIVFATIWLHDLGVFVGHRPEDPQELERWDCVDYAMHHAPGVLERVGFPRTKIAAVVEAIRTHQPSASPRSVEASIVRDADIIEQLGATAVMRTVCKIGRDTRFKTFSDALRVLKHQLDLLPGQLRFETSRTLARPRIEALTLFLASAAAENLGRADNSWAVAELVDVSSLNEQTVQ